MRKPKVVVIGAGPAGGACALELARSGRVEVVLVDKTTYPRVKVCGSGLSPHALTIIDRLELRTRLEPHHVRMAGLNARGPDGGQVHLRGAKGAWVVPRVELDATIANEAVLRGATFFEGRKVTSLLRDQAGEVRGIVTSEGEIESDLVVCANGSPSRFEREDSPRDGIRTIMGWWSNVRLNPADEGVMIWDRRLDGYYAWAFPEPKGVVNIGLTIAEGSPEANRLKPLFQEILDQYFGAELEDAEQIGKWMGHPATVTNKIGDIIEARAMWIGEAARLACPATVEGIGFAMESGMIAADAVVRHYGLERGFSPLHRRLYKARLGMHMLPKFWAAEGFLRLMRSERARKLTTRVLQPQWFAERAVTLLGEQPRPASGPASGPAPAAAAAE
jgi:menaquinone-9 beta-reductase